MKKIACIIGTRPQLIKHAALIEELEKYFFVNTINTLQHYSSELNHVLKDELYGNKNFCDLSLGLGDLSPAARLGKMIYELAIVIDQQKPDAILVYGDTDSTLAGAITAQKAGIPIIHVESGERSYNKEMPEEMNRVITDYLSQIHFCSSEESIDNLKKEKITNHVFYTGDLMKDLLFSKLNQLADPKIGAYIFCTIHRNYNKNNPTKLQELLDSLNGLSMTVMFAVHPSTVAAMTTFGIDTANYKNIQILPPLSYLQSLSSQKYSSAVITDSGGIQKEAYWLKKPCITIRKETEWKATLTGNWNQLLYDDLSKLDALLKNTPDTSQYDEQLYGSGNVSTIITNALLQLI